MYHLLHDTRYGELETLHENTATGKKLYIEGPFAMAEAKNRNNRIYPMDVIGPAVEMYRREYLDERRALGELNHPDYPMPNPRLAGIMTESLEWRGNLLYGKAQVLNTPEGNIIRGLLEANFNLGVSTRGLGSVRSSGGVDRVERYKMNAIDAVDLPSGQVCYVDAINESTQWVEDGGVWVPKKLYAKIDDEKLLEAFAGFFKHIQKRG